ncbi:MAG: hypothetical protein EOP77_00345 [Variovorax sp.]|nr:MAG: hypothetical protein EOP77_00345 [Variovorax sp.]
MNDPRPNFTQRKNDRYRLLHVMTKDEQLDVVPQEGGSQIIYVDKAYTAAHTALLIAGVVRHVRTSRVSSFALDPDLDDRLQMGSLSSEVYREVDNMRWGMRRLVAMDTGSIRANFPEHKFHPDITLGLDAIDDVRLASGHLTRRERMRELFHAIFRMSKETKYVLARSRYRKAQGKRVRATKDYIVALFKKCDRQLLVPVDLGYVRHDSINGQGELRAGLTFATVNTHRERLEKAMRRAWGSELSGFLMRLEWAPHKSFHFRLQVFLNGYRYLDRTSNAKRIGKMWVKATNGGGTHWEPEPHEGETRGTGMFHGDNPEELARLIKAATYLCKADHYIGYYKGERDRTFFRGKVH